MFFNNLKTVLPGIGFAALLSITSMFLDKALSIPLGALTIAVFLGILINNTCNIQLILKPGITFSLKRLLKLGIVLLGFKLNFPVLFKLGPQVIVMILFMVPMVLVLAWVIGRILGIDTRLSTLLGVGSCICGASAIVTVAPMIGSKQEDSAIAVSMINFLGALGVILFSGISLYLPLSDIEYGIWSGISLQGVSHALAAAFARGARAGEIATFVKMGRVVMLIPVSLVLSLLFHHGDGRNSSLNLPLYVVFFLIAGIVGSTGVLTQDVIQNISTASEFLILMAMTAMGLCVELTSIWKKGLKSFVLTAIIFVFVSVVSILLIKFLNIGI